MSGGYTSSAVPPPVLCEKCKSPRTVITESTTYGHYYQCTTCRHTWYAQATTIRFAD
jgi:ssDNA-binding Zn-finger/Zn-ribbon topoisomerase 1